MLAAESSTSSSNTTLCTLPVASSSVASTSNHTLPFSISQAVSLPSTSISSVPSLAVVDDQSRVILVGPLAKSSGSIAPSRLPQANEGQKRLFDEIFGTEDPLASALGKGTKTFKGKEKIKLDGGLEILETPAHSLPPVKLLWRSMLLAAPPPSATAEENLGVVGMEIEEDAAEKTKEEGDASEVKYSNFSSVSLTDIFKARLKLGESPYATFSESDN